MRHLLLTLDFPPNRPGGMSNYCKGLAEHFPGSSLSVLTGAAPRGYNDTVAARVYRAPIKNGSGLRILLWLLYTFFIIIKERSAVLHCGNSSPFRHIAYLCSVCTGIPFVIYFFGTDVHALHRRIHKNPMSAFISRAIFKRCSGIIAISHYTANCVESLLGVPHSKILLVNPGLDPLYAQASSLPVVFPAKTIRLVTIGRLAMRKGVDMVLRALPLVKSHGITVSYTVIGRGDQSYYLDIARECGIENDVNFIGYVADDTALISLIRDSDVFIMVSRELDKRGDVEGFGMVFIEAAALGRPVIGSCSGGIPDAVNNGVNGILVENPESPQEIATAIIRLAADPGYARTLGENGRKWVREHFDWSEIGQRFNNDLQRLIHSC